jgi:hypothetical protein
MYHISMNSKLKSELFQLIYLVPLKIRCKICDPIQRHIWSSGFAYRNNVLFILLHLIILLYRLICVLMCLVVYQCVSRNDRKRLCLVLSFI